MSSSSWKVNNNPSLLRSSRSQEEGEIGEEEGEILSPRGGGGGGAPPPPPPPPPPRYRPRFVSSSQPPPQQQQQQPPPPSSQQHQQPQHQQQPPPSMNQPLRNDDRYHRFGGGRGGMGGGRGGRGGWGRGGGGGRGGWKDGPHHSPPPSRPSFNRNSSGDSRGVGGGGPDGFKAPPPPPRASPMHHRSNEFVMKNHRSGSDAFARMDTDNSTNNNGPPPPFHHRNANLKKSNPPGDPRNVVDGGGRIGGDPRNNDPRGPRPDPPQRSPSFPGPRSNMNMNNATNNSSSNNNNNSSGNAVNNNGNNNPGVGNNPRGPPRFVPASRNPSFSMQRNNDGGGGGNNAPRGPPNFTPPANRTSSFLLRESDVNRSQSFGEDPPPFGRPPPQRPDDFHHRGSGSGDLFRNEYSRMARSDNNSNNNNGSNNNNSTSNTSMGDMSSFRSFERSRPSTNDETIHRQDSFGRMERRRPSGDDNPGGVFRHSMPDRHRSGEDMALPSSTSSSSLFRRDSYGRSTSTSSSQPNNNSSSNNNNNGMNNNNDESFRSRGGFGSINPPPVRRMSSYSSLADNPPPAVRRPSEYRSPPAPRRKSFQPNPMDNSSNNNNNNQHHHHPHHHHPPPHQHHHQQQQKQQQQQPPPQQHHDDNKRVKNESVVEAPSGPLRPPASSAPRPRPAPAARDPRLAFAKQEDTPLTCATLGGDAVSKAEGAVQHLSDLLNKPELLAKKAGATALPPSKLIMKSMNLLETKINSAGKDVTKANESLEETQKEQTAAEERRGKLVEEEVKRKEAQQNKEREDQEWAERTSALEKQLEKKKEEIEKERKEFTEKMQEGVLKAKNEERKRLRQEMKGQMEQAALSFDADIVKAERQVEKALKEAANAEARATTLTSEYQSIVQKSSSAAGLQHEPAKTAESVERILAENKQKAQEAQTTAISFLRGPPTDTSAFVDPVHGRTNEEWTEMACQVTGPADALYTQPNESPFYEQNVQTHEEIGHLVKEGVRKKKRKLKKRWTALAEEYLVRKQIFDSQTSKRGSMLEKSTTKRRGRASILNIAGASNAASTSSTTTTATPSAGGGGGGRNSNPYRRARRGQVGGVGDVVRSEYEQEQIIAELTAQEAMEKRIAHGGSKLPRQVSRLERKLTATYYNSFNSHRVLDPKQEAYEQSVTNVWTDMEKCIFLDRFLQYPKDFRKIATYLRNKSTKDCIAFYYNSKQTVPYKKALKEHLMRRKRRGDYHVWDETIQAALSVGAVVKAGTGEDKPLLFMLPDDDLSYKTRHLHPLSLELLSSMELPPPPPVAESTSKKSKDGKSRKRNRDPLFILDPREQKFLRRSSQESASTVKRVNSQDDSKLGRSSSTSSLSSVKGETEKTPPPRKAQHRWSAGEKRLLLEAFEKHGKNWQLLSAAVGTKSVSQVKSYYQEHKKLFARNVPTTTEDTRAQPMEEQAKNPSVAVQADPEKTLTGAAPPANNRIDAATAAVLQGKEEERRFESSEEQLLRQMHRAEIQAGLERLQSERRTPDAELWNQLQPSQLLSQQQQQQQQQQLLQAAQAQLSTNMSILPLILRTHAFHHQQQQQRQQTQQQQQQHVDSLAANASVRDWMDAQTIQNAYALRQAQAQAGHHAFAMDPHLRTAFAQQLANSGLLQPQGARSSEAELSGSQSFFGGAQGAGDSLSQLRLAGLQAGSPATLGMNLLARVPRTDQQQQPRDSSETYGV